MDTFINAMFIESEEFKVRNKPRQNRSGSWWCSQDRISGRNLQLLCNPDRHGFPIRIRRQRRRRMDN